MPWKIQEINRSDITDVILVGGSSRMPMVKDSLAKIFGKESNIW